jgi:ribonuclease P protein component, eubacterial
MLSIKNRLIKREDFSKAYQKGNFFAGENIAIKATRNKLPETRVGFSVGKKFFKKAVARNKAKRRLRESVRPYLVKIKPGFDIVIFCRKGGLILEKNGLSEAKKELREIIKRANLFKN